MYKFIALQLVCVCFCYHSMLFRVPLLLCHRVSCLVYLRFVRGPRALRDAALRAVEVAVIFGGVRVSHQKGHLSELSLQG